MDANVIDIKDNSDFRVISNVSSTTFGLHDLDERIVDYILKEKASRRKRFGKSVREYDTDESSDESDDDDEDIETVNAYSELISHIKEDVAANGAVVVDLLRHSMSTDEDASALIRKESELYIDTNLISKKICKDLYDWALAHIQKAIVHSDLPDESIEEIVIIGTDHKLPGFKDYLKLAYKEKLFRFVSEDKLAAGASLVVKIFFKLILNCHPKLNYSKYLNNILNKYN